ncbi:laccase TilA [Aspergillus heteromorphus CBS 117.55]|uniref:Laccase TilA n=1 Tax=Aspergillus heteromorphus CBS 117.55 TaxID=1448321 RepID=A0A317WUF6_9EURO|nr:laccase TilA [Aspergillus heteromorphus CBS 117.55]PWY90054.1 laccase TilA [Aspergillus heteromorphus CBS 117.55]
MPTIRCGLVFLALILCLVSWANGSDLRVRSTGNTVRFNVTLTWEDWAPAGVPRKMILMNGQFPGPALELRQGDDVEFLVINDTPANATVHFHGIEQLDTPWSDGTPGLSQRPIVPGGRFLYKWRALQYGSYFYHAHSRGQLEDGLYGPIYIRPDDSVEKPFNLITNSTSELQAMRAAEEKTSPVILADWRQLTSEELWHAEEATGLDAYCSNALLINGKGSIICPGAQAYNDLATAEQKQTLGNMSMTDIGCLPPTLVSGQGDFPHNYNAMPPSMFYGCTPGNGGSERFLVDPSAKYVSYDLISAAGVALLTFAIDQHPMYVYAIDGRYIEPKLVDAITIPNSNRFSVLVKLDKPAGDYTIRLADSGLTQILNMTATLTYDTPIKTQQGPSIATIDIHGALVSSNYTLLDETTVIPFPVEVPSLEVAQTHVLRIGHYNASYRWTMGNSSMPLSLEEASPLLFYPSTAQPDLTIATLNGSWVDLIFHVQGQIQPPHPIHKHSNKFFVIGQGNGTWNYSSVAEAMRYIPGSFNFINPQIRDTFTTPVSVTEDTWLALRYQVVNPGAFLLHCHIQVHLSGGMALAILDGVDEWPVIPEKYRIEAGAN